MGHKPGFELWKHQRSAAMRRISRSQFLDEFNTPSHYRPESQGANRSHLGQAPSEIYYGSGQSSYFDWLENFGGQ